MGVDYIMGLTYKEVDLDEDPCIFPQCGHIVIMSNLDGIMDMAKHYVFEGSTIKAIKCSSESFSSKEVKVCPQCRGSLRNLSRYGRVVRRAHLDESTKRFMTQARYRYNQIAETLATEQEILCNLDSNLQLGSMPSVVKLAGSAEEQLQAINKTMDKARRYAGLRKCRSDIFAFIKQARENEMPFARMCEVMEANRRLRGVEQERGEVFGHDNSVITSTFRLQGTSLRIRCELSILTDFVSRFTKTYGRSPKSTMTLGLMWNRDEAQKLVEDASKAKDIVRQTEGHVFIASMVALELTYLRDAQARGPHKALGNQHLAMARDLCKHYPGTTRRAHLPSEIVAVASSLEKGFLDAPLSIEERRQVLKAMSEEFRGTGHWYECMNGHPFSIGECGMPMQRAACPTCGEAIGGTHHEAVEGVQRSTELEAELREMTLGR